jgi:hypothetical protein
MSFGNFCVNVNRGSQTACLLNVMAILYDILEVFVSLLFSYLFATGALCRIHCSWCLFHFISDRDLLRW